MPKSISNLVPEQWRDLVELLTAPVSWIPGMQRFLLEFVFGAPSAWLAAAYFILLLFPILRTSRVIHSRRRASYLAPIKEAN